MGTDIHGGLFYKSWKDEYQFVELPPVFSGRNYDFFAILAGVRNGYGFAGCARHTPVTPIAENKGIPKVLSSFEAKDTWIFGDHSKTHVTLKDILQTDKHLVQVVRYGVFTEHEYKLIKDNKSLPEDIDYCGDITGKGVQVLDDYQYDKGNFELEYYNNSSKGKIPKELYIRTSWEEKPFVTIIEKLKQWMLLYAPYDENKYDEVILAVGFDS